MRLKYEEAEKLKKIQAAAYTIYSLMEDMRPGGGFKEDDEKEECKYCGAKTPTLEDCGKLIGCWNKTWGWDPFSPNTDIVKDMYSFITKNNE